MVTFTRRSRGVTSCWIALMTVSVAILMTSTFRFRVQARSLSKDDEIEAFLNRVNKPAVKSFTLADGDIIDCVDIHKQPAFDHPLLKDHKIIMTPSPFPKMDKPANASSHPIAGVATLQHGEKCPEGTVPIRRTQKSDIINAKSLTGYGTRDGVPVWEMVEGAGIIWEAGRDPYFGARGIFNVWQVPEVEDNSWSRGAVAVSDDDDKAFIEAGWMANPGVYGDKKTRSYAYWTADGYVSTGCYNLICPGFIQIHPMFPLGTAIGPLSSYDGQQYVTSFSVQKDKDQNVWWMYVQDTPVGYWPGCLFNKFVEASKATWTGGVFNTNNGGRHTTTDMGNGHFANEGWAKAAFVKEWLTMSKDEGWSHPAYRSFADKASCYSVKLEDDHVLYYGGPGLGAEGC